MAQTLKFGNKVWAAKEDSVLAYNDINNNYKPLPFDFARASIGTRVNKAGLIETMGQDIARIDYTDSADGVLLLEPSAVNQMTNSEDFTSWSKQGAATISLENINNPVNSTNANLITVDSNGIYANITTPNASSVYAISFWLYKNNNIGNIVLDNAQGGTNGKWEINLDLLPNSFVRIDKSHPSVNVLYQFTTLASGDIAPFFKSPNGIKSFYVTGFQLELGTYITSYIPTSGSSVTRAAETCNNSGNSEVFNDSEGVLFADISALADTAYIAVGTNSLNRILLGSSNTYVRSYNNIGGILIDFTSSILASKNNKLAIKYKSGDTDFYINGFKVFESNTAFTASVAFDTLEFQNLVGSTQNFYGKTKELGYYNTILTDAELETLTSYRNWVSMVNELNLNIIYNG